MDNMKWWIVCFSCVIASSWASDKKIICPYFGFESCGTDVEPENLDPFLCTHVMYAYVNLNELGEIQLQNETIELGENEGQNCIKRVLHLKELNKDLKVILSIGYGIHSSEAFSKVAKNRSLRYKFVQNLYNFVTLYGFDGINVEWFLHYPDKRHRHDKKNFQKLIKELDAQFRPRGLELSTMLPQSTHLDEDAYDISSLIPHLDYVSVIYAGILFNDTNTTEFRAPLLVGPGDSMQSNKSIDAAVRYYLKSGVPREKLMIEMSPIGYLFQLKSKDSPILGALTVHKENWEDSILGYYQICQGLKKGWKIHWDDDRKATYAVDKDAWMSYESVQSAAAKAQYVIDQQLGGVLVSGLEWDDVFDDCGDGEYALTAAVKNTFDENLK